MEHLVPPATCWTTLHDPEAQRWNEVPPMQFHIPSLVQGPVKAEPEPAGVAGAAEGSAEGAAGGAAEGAAIGAGEASGLGTAGAALD